jgi:tetratricopeptide (TPR) repeat protein
MKEMHYGEYKRILKIDTDMEDEYKRKAEEESKEAMIKKEQRTLEDYLKEGNTFAQTGKYDEAIEKYKELIKIYPNYSQARFNLGVVYKKKGDHKEALSAFKEFVEMDPFNKMVDVANDIIKELTQI